MPPKQYQARNDVFVTWLNQLPGESLRNILATGRVARDRTGDALDHRDGLNRPTALDRPGSCTRFLDRTRRAGVLKEPVGRKAADYPASSVRFQM
jgi:hypothetical protein